MGFRNQMSLKCGTCPKRKRVYGLNTIASTMKRSGWKLVGNCWLCQQCVTRRTKKESSVPRQTY